MFFRSKWIWTEDYKRINNWAIFKIEFEMEKIFEKVDFKIGVETKYYLYINGQLVVFEGGLFRESTVGNGYFDELEISKYLTLGKNTIEIKCWFFGNGGRNNVKIDKAGLIFESEVLNLFSDSKTLSSELFGHYQTITENPSYLYGGFNIGFDKNKEKLDYKNSTEIGDYGDAPFGTLAKRPIPQIKFSDINKVDYTKIGDKYIIKLPYAMQFSPYFKVKAKGLEVIDIRSDRYAVNGGPGDSLNSYFGHRTEYICNNSIQEYESLDYLFGEEIIFSAPSSVEIIELGYRESSYDSKLKNIKVADERLNKLLQKCLRTLKVCARDNFMDCPDRERGQWIGDVSVQAPQVFFGMDENGVKLLRKACCDFINLRKGDRLFGNVPGDHFSELPSQSLNAISEVGMIATYYANTKDKEIIKLAFEPAVKYLKLWEMENGLVSKMAGSWYWFDHLFNVDEKVLENCWYYSALKFAKTMSEILKDDSHNDFLCDRIKSIEDNFDKTFWKGDHYGSSNFVDERANALAVVCNLAGKDKFSKLEYVLISVYNSSTYMEGYVLEAMCKMGYKDDAFRRMMSRYYNLIENENSTLWEDFNILGTKNHAWTGSPLTIICRYFPELLLN